jgi:hypothetical protein
LRKQTPKLLRIGADLDRAFPVLRLDMLSVLGEKVTHRLRTFSDDAGVVVVENDAQPEHSPSVLGQTAIAEIEA